MKFQLIWHKTNDKYNNNKYVGPLDFSPGGEDVATAQDKEETANTEKKVQHIRLCGQRAKEIQA
jgi:hypothetical protein